MITIDDKVNDYRNELIKNKLLDKLRVGEYALLKCLITKVKVDTSTDKIMYTVEFGGQEMVAYEDEVVSIEVLYKNLEVK